MLKGWKTVLFNLCMLALGSPEVLSLIPPKVAIYVTVVGNLALRAITSTPIGRRE